MDNLKVLEVIGVYRQKFESLRVSPCDYPHGKLLPLFFRRSRALGHCFQMLGKMEEFIAEGRLDKVFRWLGFIQGALWVLRIYALEELKDHSRPTE